ncbi:cbb3-type cytochrome c oxidase subunit I [Vibrio lentus]|nr:cbb3-type cytochrome c oxidase subunit I [Vibrio lentus]
MSLGLGEFGRTGWLAYPPLSGIEASPGVRSIIGYGRCKYPVWNTTLTGVNFFATILRMRTPSMPMMMKMPVFTWASLCANILIIISFHNPNI